MLKERMINSKEGFGMIAVLFLLQLLMLAAVVFMPGLLKVVFVLAAVVVLVCWFGFYMVHPNQSAVLQLFGRYVGTDLNNGLGRGLIHGQVDSRLPWQQY